MFVVEQGVAYPDLDGRDLEPDAWHCWAEEDGEVVACLRLLREDDGRGVPGGGPPGGGRGVPGGGPPGGGRGVPGGAPPGRDWWRIGRVATRPAARRRGQASALVRRALELAAGPVMLDAQAHLVRWYAGFGFEPQGAPYLYDGIPHVRMTRD